MHTSKVLICFDLFLQFNFVGRVIGPRGMTLREVESSTGCKLLVRGKGSMKDKKLVSFVTCTKESQVSVKIVNSRMTCDKSSLYMQEEEKRGQPNYEHLEEDLHVLISVEDTEERAKLRLAKAVEKAKDLLQPVVCWLGFVFSCH